MKLNRTLWGSWEWKPFCVPHFLFVGNRLQPPWPSLSSRGQVQRVANRDGRGCRDESCIKKRQCRLGAGARFCLKGYTWYLWTRLQNWNFQQVGDVNLMKHSSFQKEGHSLITSRTRDAYQETTWGQIKEMQWKSKLLSPVWLSATPWSVACQAPLSMEFSRQEYWSGWSFPFAGDLPNPGLLYCM